MRINRATGLALAVVVTVVVGVAAAHAHRTPGAVSSLSQVLGWAVVGVLSIGIVLTVGIWLRTSLRAWRIERTRRMLERAEREGA
jgi:FtsH-binding integral membrane protein